LILPEPFSFKAATKEDLQAVWDNVRECDKNELSLLGDKGYEDFAVEAAISKVFATDCLWRTVDEALQVAGGNGYMREFPYERILRDVRINRIFEGTNDILQLFIGLTAMNTASGLLKNVAKVLGNITSGKLFNDPIKGFGYLGDYSKRWVASTTGIGSATMTKVHPELVACQKVIETHARVTGALTDKLLRKHGKEIIHKQLATKRMAQIFIDLYVLSCVTSRVTQSIEEKGVEEAAREIEIAKTFAFQADERIRRNIQRMDENEDESIKSLAVYACEQEKYVWDNI